MKYLDKYEQDKEAEYTEDDKDEYKSQPLKVELRKEEDGYYICEECHIKSKEIFYGTYSDKQQLCDNCVGDLCICIKCKQPKKEICKNLKCKDCHCQDCIEYRNNYKVPETQWVRASDYQ